MDIKETGKTLVVLVVVLTCVIIVIFVALLPTIMIYVKLMRHDTW